MKISILVDNYVIQGSNLKGETGFSALVHLENKKILFDVGIGRLFIENALKLNYSLLDLDYIVLSHGHDDHVGGLYHLVEHFKNNPPRTKPVLLTHPATFNFKLNSNNEPSGNILSSDIINHYFHVHLSKEPYLIDEKTVFLGEVLRKYEIEQFLPKGRVLDDTRYIPDCLYEDSALAIKTTKGIVLLTGCSHSGICSMLNQSQQLFPHTPIYDIVGGLHLLEDEIGKVNGIVECLHKFKPDRLHPCHCTHPNHLKPLSRVTQVITTGAGSIIEY